MAQDIVSEQPERFFVSEIIRKHIFLQYQQEVPYSVAGGRAGGRAPQRPAGGWTRAGSVRLLRFGRSHRERSHTSTGS